MKKNGSLKLVVLIIMFFLTPAVQAQTSAFQKADMFMMGDRLIDVTYHLGYVPAAAAAGCGSAIKEKIQGKTRFMGCPGKLNNNRDKIFRTIAEKQGITRFVVEKNIQSCSIDKSSSKIEEVSEKNGLYTVEYVDFSKGIDNAVSQVASILGCPEKGKHIMSKYNKKLGKTQKKIKGISYGKKVLILYGTYMKNTGKVMLQVEAPGNYSDTHMLAALGCKNVADKLMTDTTKLRKGMFQIRDLKNLAAASPDVIVAAGSSFAVQKAVAAQLAKDPSLKTKVPALTNLAVFSLPLYTESSVMDYPLVLRKWADALM